MSVRRLSPDLGPILRTLRHHMAGPFAPDFAPNARFLYFGLFQCLFGINKLRDIQNLLRMWFEIHAGEPSFKTNRSLLFVQIAVATGRGGRP